MDWYAGTSGYSYAAWKGPFYPEDLGSDEFLAYYADRLPAVEINNTFYRMPRTSVLEAWAAAVPDHFRFSIKASRRITHQLRLKEAAEPTRYLIDKLAVLGDKLGAVLFQLPPNLRADRDRLAAFLEVLDGAVPAAFEFRHPSWLEPDIVELLRDASVALCHSEDDGDLPAMTEAPVSTAPWVYLRLRKAAYTDAELQGWLGQAGDSGALRGFAFFKHEDAGAGPVLAERFLELAGQSEVVPLQAPARPRRAPKRATSRPRKDRPAKSRSESS